VRAYGRCVRPPVLVHPVDLDWTTHVGNSGQRWQPLPEMGPRGHAVIDELFARVTDLKPCEHARRRDVSGQA